MKGAERIVLVGMMGAGKTTVGRRLSDALGWSLLDSDEIVLGQQGMSAHEVLERQGVDALRRAEARALDDAANRPGPAVLAVAAGTILDPAHRELLRHAGLVVWLRAKMDTLADRARSASGPPRPWLGSDPRAELEHLYEGRAELYRDIADLIIDVDEMAPPTVVDRILQTLGLARAQRGVDVVSCGATGDGETDDTDAI